MILDVDVTLEDAESVDAEYARSLQWVLENDPTDLCLTFQVDHEEYGEVSQHELKPGGADIEVTDENKKEYVDLVLKNRFLLRIKPQMDMLLEGLHSVVPKAQLSIFDERELELLMSGLTMIDIADWQSNTEYRGYLASSQPIVWFWEAVHSFTSEQQARLLQFVTGTSRVPMNGFSELHGANGPRKFTISNVGKPTDFPRAHTCFNRIDLPPYATFQMMRQRLLYAIENTSGFDGVD